MLFPYVLGNYAATEGRGLYGFHIVSSNEPGVIEEIVDAVAEMGLKTYIMTVSVPSPSASEACVYLVVDLTGREGEASALADRLRGLKGVKDVDLIRPSPEGMLVNPYLYPMVMAGKPGVFLGEAESLGMLWESRARFGHVTVSTILYHIGYTTGSMLYEAYEGLVKPGDLRGLLNLLLNRLTASSMARAEVVELRPGLIRLRLYDQWECRTLKGKMLNEATSHFLRGVLAGFLSRATGRRVSAVETRCINLGDLYCEILLAW